LALSLIGIAARVRAEELSGRVATLNDDPLPGVWVRLTSLDGAISNRVTATDGTGRFLAVGLPPGAYRVAAEIPGFDRREGQVVIAPGRPARFDMVLVVSPREQRVCICDPIIDSATAPLRERRPQEWRVRVLDTANQPMPDATVEVPSLQLILTTGSDGAVCFWGPERRFPTVRVTAWPFRPVEMDLCCIGNNGSVTVGRDDVCPDRSGS
jgi:hypothetical protein